jgi:hypothetical protein
MRLQIPNSFDIIPPTSPMTLINYASKLSKHEDLNLAA